MSLDASAKAYWREEFSLIALLLLFFIAIVAFAYTLPFDARLFPLIIGCAGIALTLAVALPRPSCRRRHSACCSGCSASSSPRSPR
jgi:hypothetical protein